MMKVVFILILEILFLMNNSTQAQKKYIAVNTMEEQMIVDGSAKEKFWSKAILDSLPINITHPGEPMSADYKVYFKAAYDLDNFYCLAFVTDDRMVTWLQTQTEAWNADCIEMFFNTYVNDPGHPLEECHFLVGINQNQYPPVFSGQLFSYPTDPVYFEGYKYSTSKTKNGYNIEMQLPWLLIIDDMHYPSPSIEPGTQIPWDINGCDTDDAAIKRDLITGWNADWGYNWTDNSRYGILELGDNTELASALFTKPELNIKALSKNIYYLEINSLVNAGTTIKITNLEGKCVSTALLRYGENILNLTKASPGVYIVTTVIKNRPCSQKLEVH